MALYTQGREDSVSVRYLEFGPPEGNLEVKKDQQKRSQSKCIDNELCDGQASSHPAHKRRHRNWRLAGGGQNRKRRQGGRTRESRELTHIDVI